MAQLLKVVSLVTEEVVGRMKLRWTNIYSYKLKPVLLLKTSHIILSAYAGENEVLQ